MRTDELDNMPPAVELCGVQDKDYPELVCEYPLGHGLINEPDQDVFNMEHGAPSKGGWFNPEPEDWVPPLTPEEHDRKLRRDTLLSVVELLGDDLWGENEAEGEYRENISRWLEQRIDLFDRGLWSAIPTKTQD